MDTTSIIDRIKVSGHRLGVTKTDLAQVLNRLADERDVNSLRLLFFNYCDWEGKHSLGEDPVEQFLRCVDNFEAAAQIGDCIRAAKGDAIRGLTMFDQNPDVTGPTTQFFRSYFQKVQL